MVFSGSPTCRQAGRLLNLESKAIRGQWISIDDPSTGTYNSPVQCSSKDLVLFWCVGGGCVCLSINHTLAALIAVHGAWDEWSPWSLCSSTCGRGYRSRTRTCTPPQFGGDPCEGPEKQTKFCNIAVCPGKENTQNQKENNPGYSQTTELR